MDANAGSQGSKSRSIGLTVTEKYATLKLVMLIADDDGDGDIA
jgi:hypothetical protein